MRTRAIKTAKVSPGETDIIALCETSLPVLDESTILVVTSKIISLCEHRVASIDTTDKSTLVAAEAERYLPADNSKYGMTFTITNNTLIPVAGIDESNSDGNYVLWPRDAQASANMIREHFAKQYGLERFGVIVTDSTSQPLRRGTVGIALAHSGFKALRNYVGQADLFGKPIATSQASVVAGLAAAAVLVMGEGAEQTPLCILSELGFVDFQAVNPSAEELAELYVLLHDDLFAPFLENADWKSGGKREPGA